MGWQTSWLQGAFREMESRSLPEQGKLLTPFVKENFFSLVLSPLLSLGTLPFMAYRG
jgi:hypothetical protein